MASSRIAYDPTKPMGQKYNQLIRTGAQFRQMQEEFRREVEAYVDDNTTLATDMGMVSAAVATNWRTLLAQSVGEMSSTVIQAGGIAQGGETGVKQLLDFTA